MALSIRGILMLVVLGGLGSLGRVGESAEHRNYDYFKYHNMSEISAWMEQTQKDNQDIVTIMSYGETYENKTIKLLKIGLASSEKKKAIWMDCGIHSREWIAPAFCQYVVKQILDTYKTDEEISQMLKNMDFYITPVLNIDGYEYTWLNDSTRLWRKSRSPGNCGDSCMGTDLNRNFAANWGTVGISRNCCSEVYNGATVLSESEAQAVTKFVEQRRNEILCFLTIHSYGQLILLPYGHPNVSAPNYDELLSVGQAAAEAIKHIHGMAYRVGTSPNVLYPNSGSSRDWARLIGIPFSFTFELRDKGEHGFKLPEDQIKPACEEAYAGFRSIVTYVHDKAFNIPPPITNAPPSTTPAPGAATSLIATTWIVLLASLLTSATLL